MISGSVPDRCGAVSGRLGSWDGMRDEVASRVLPSAVCVSLFMRRMFVAKVIGDMGESRVVGPPTSWEAGSEESSEGCR